MTDNERKIVEQKVIRKLLNKRVVESNPASVDEVLHWFVEDEMDKIREIIRQSSSDSRIPINLEENRGREVVYLSDIEQAFDLLEQERTT